MGWRRLDCRRGGGRADLAFTSPTTKDLGGIDHTPARPRLHRRTVSSTSSAGGLVLVEIYEVP